MLDELTDIVLDDVFLFYQGFLGEGMCERSSLTGVVGIVGHSECSDADQGLNGTDVDGIFVEVWVSDSVAVDVFPGLDGVEVKFIGGDADDTAIFVVEELILKCDASF
jgi:hypothetical protein